MSARYVGRIGSVPDDFAFITISTVTKESGMPHGLATTKDVFIHRDDCGVPLVVGLQIIFDVVEDRKRGQGHFRATGAEQLAKEDVLPSDVPAIPGLLEAVAGFLQTDTQSLAIRPPGMPYLQMKEVSPADLEKVIANNPLPHVPRHHRVFSDEVNHQVLQAMLLLRYPALVPFSADYRILDPADGQLDTLVGESVAGYKRLHLDQEIGVLEEQVRRFKSERKTLKFIWDQNLVRPDTIIPIEQFPDMFMAAPVFYLWASEQQEIEISSAWEDRDPMPNEAVRFFCELFKSQTWYDTFQLWNRRTRSFRQYKGEVIPPHIRRVMSEAITQFDHVVIATPYHDQAGKDWEDLKWLRAIDPWVYGFKKDFPWFFILGHYSDAGSLLHHDVLTADTIAFLRANKTRLAGFNSIRRPYWLRTNGVNVGQDPFGDHLMKHVDLLLAAFEQGNLFDWLRGTTKNSAPKKAKS